MLRRSRLAACTFLLAAMAIPAWAQDQVVSYTPDFFVSANPATAMDMINRLPGFSFDGGDGSRGFSGNAGNVQINGRRPSSKNEGLSTVLSRIVAGDVERIDVIAGGAPGIDMQGKAVIANVIKKAVDSTNLVVTASMNYFNTGRGIPAGQIQFSHTDGTRSYNLGIRRDASFSDDMGMAEITRTDIAGNSVYTEQKRRGSGGTVAVNGAAQTPLLGGDLAVNASASQNEYASATTYYYVAGPQDFASTSRNRNGELGANYSYDFGGPVLDLVALQRIGNSKSTSILDPNGTNSRQSSLRDTGESIARASLRVPLNDALTLEGGAEAAYNTLSGVSELSTGGVTVPVPNSEVDVNELRGEVFGTMSWQVREDLTFDAGLRAEYSTLSQPGGTVAPRSLFYPKPRAQLSWSPDENTQLRLRAERRVGQLNFGDFISSANLTQGNITAGNPDILPDNRWQYEAVYERRFWDKGAVTVSLLHQQISDLLDNKPLFTTSGVYDIRGNIGDGTATRLSVDATIPTDAFGIPGGRLGLEGDWSDSELTDPVTGLMRRFSGEDPSSYEASFTQDLTDLSSTWSVSYNDGWKDTGYRLKQITRNYGAPGLFASWTYRPSTDLNFSFSINQMLKAKRQSERFYYSDLRDRGFVTRSEVETSYSRPRFYVSMRKTFN
jgi:hypothetical protein